MFDVNSPGSLAYHLLAGPGFLRYEYEDISFYLGGAAKSKTFLPLFGCYKLVLFLYPGAYM